MAQTLGRKCKVDRISALPDVLLAEILVRMEDLDTIVKTSTLSTRWVKVWTEIFQLPFGLSFLKKIAALNDLEKYLNIVNDVMRKVRAVKIHSLEICLPFYEEDLTLPEENSPSSEEYDGIEGIDLNATLENWVSRVKEWEVNTLVLDACPDCFFNYTPFVRIPSPLLCCESLITLKIGLNFGRLGCGLESPSLPNLKTLHVVFYDEHYLHMAKLFAACPLLEELDLCLWELTADYVLDICLVKLRMLKLWVAGGFGIVKCMLKCPCLEQLQLEGDHNIDYDFVMKPSGLVKFVDRIEMRKKAKKQVYLKRSDDIFHGIASVQILQLNGALLHHVPKMEHYQSGFPIFQNLRNIYDASWRSLRIFFTCCPNLEYLSLHIGHDQLTYKFFYLELGNVFPSRLREVVVELIEFDVLVGQMLRLFLRNRRSMQKMTIVVEPCNGENFNGDSESCRSIISYAKRWGDCQVVFDIVNMNNATIDNSP